MTQKFTFNALLASSTEGSQLLLSSIRIVKSQMANQVTFVAEGFATFRAFMSLLTWRRRHVVGIVIQVLMATEKLFLPEALITLIALIWLLISVNKHVRFQMTLRDRSIGAQIAFKAFLSFVSLAMQLQNKNEQIGNLRKCLKYSKLPWMCIGQGKICHTSYTWAASLKCAISGREYEDPFCDHK